MKKLICCLMAGVFVLASSIAFGTTVRDNMEFKGKTKIFGFTLPVAATHSYTTNEDWTLSASEKLYALYVTASGSGNASIVDVGGVAGTIKIVRNGAAGTVTIKESGQTGIAIATGKTAVVIHNGTDYIRVTGDATH
jgi:hypothetical protein